MNAKKVWITEHDAGLVTLSIESSRPEIDYARISSQSSLFPNIPTDKYPLRHVLLIQGLDADSLYLIEKAISEYLHGS